MHQSMNFDTLKLCCLAAHFFFFGRGPSPVNNFPSAVALPYTTGDITKAYRLNDLAILLTNLHSRAGGQYVISPPSSNKAGSVRLECRRTRLLGETVT